MSNPDPDVVWEQYLSKLSALESHKKGNKQPKPVQTTVVAPLSDMAEMHIRLHATMAESYRLQEIYLNKYEVRLTGL